MKDVSDVSDEDLKYISRVLMAFCTILGIWQNEMRVPLPGRMLVVEREGHRWKLDERGYPVPSQDLLEEIERLRKQEDQPQR
jgi:hypothetical protein